MALPMDRRIGFMGAGQMAEAMARGFLAKGLLTADRMCASDPNQERKDIFNALGITTYDTCEQVRGCPQLMSVGRMPAALAHCRWQSMQMCWSWQ